jgi:hypothetical protein
MKHQLLHLASLAIIVTFIGCKSAVIYDTPNSLRNINGTLHLTNGKSVDGKLIINTDYAIGTPIKVYAPGEKEPMKFSLYDVKGYEMRGSYYALKQVHGGLQLGNNFSFMKRLTPENSRIHLYENIDKRINRNVNNMSTTSYDYEYYLQMPNETGDDVWRLSSSKFTPNFDEKMSLLLSDCPTLARKIADKQEGYFYRQVSFTERRADVLLNIISEYNKCR